MKRFIILIIFSFSHAMYSQENLPFKEIPIEAETYTAQNVAGRMIDGLGFRYYWATEGLRAEDLQYQPKGNGRNCLETITHLFNLSNVLIQLTKTEFSQKKQATMSFAEMRAQTLWNLKAVSNRIKNSKNLSEFDAKKDGKVTIPFYNLINGPIADAIWHTGQVASFRRSSGNPINSKVNHFSGTVRK